MYKYLSPEERMERIARILLRAIALDEVSGAREANESTAPSNDATPRDNQRSVRRGNDSRRS